MKTLRRGIPILIGTVLLLNISACDISNPIDDVGIIVEVEDAEVDLGSDGIAVDVDPHAPSVSSETVSNNLDIESIDALHRVRLKPEFFAFNSNASKSSDVAATGTLQFSVFLAGWPLPGTPFTVTIENDVVTTISPNQINFAGQTYSVDEESLTLLLDALGSDAPNLEDWQDATMDEVVAAVNTALAANSFPLSIAVNVTDSDAEDPLNGELILKTISIDATISN